MSFDHILTQTLLANLLIFATWEKIYINAIIKEHRELIGSKLKTIIIVIKLHLFNICDMYESHLKNNLENICQG